MKLLSMINKVIVRSCVGDQHVKRISSNEVNITSRARQQVKHVVVCHISSKLHGLGGGAPGGHPHGQGGCEAEVGKSGRVDHQPEGQGGLRDHFLSMGPETSSSLQTLLLQVAFNISFLQAAVITIALAALFLPILFFLS